MKQKLMNSHGESIAESLVSILIVAVASILFAGMVTASQRVIEQSTRWMNDYYEAVSYINQQEPLDNSVEEYDGVSVSFNFTISISGNPTYKKVTALVNDKLGVPIVRYIKENDSTTP